MYYCSSSLRFCYVAMLIGTLLSGVLLAQNRSTGEIIGTVTDPGGAIVPTVEVTVMNVATGVVVHLQTNDAGAYDAPLLQPGTYEVTFEKPGFRKIRRPDIRLELDQTARIDARLELGQSQQIVTVNDVNPILESDSSQQSTVFSTALTQNLPLVGRDPSRLAILAPGTSTAQQTLGGIDPGRVNVGGNRAFTLQATLNGGSVVLPNSNNFGDMVPPLGAISEFSVIQDNFSAEFGTGTSVLNMITKSGSNEFHGSLFEFIQNDYLNARNSFATTKQKLRYNQFGGTIGGPVVKNKLFFFFSFQDTKNPNSSPSIVTVPTVAARNGDLSAFSTLNPALFPNRQIPASQIDPVAKAALSFWPTPNYGGANATTNNYFLLRSDRPSTPIYDGKVDWVLNSNQQLSGTVHYKDYSVQHTGQIPGPACLGGEYCGTEGQTDQSWQLVHRWTATPTSINELHISFLREVYSTTSPSFGGNYPSKLGLNSVAQYYFPSFSISGQLPTSLGAGQHYGGAQNNFIYTDTFSWIAGQHNLKFGGQFVKPQQNPRGDWNSSNFTFNGQYTGLGFADFLTGQVYAYGFSAQPNSLGVRRTTGAAFIADTWRATPKLTINMGLRYQYEGGFYEAHNRLSNFAPQAVNPATGTLGALVFATDANKYLQQNHGLLVAPRVGFAYSLPGNTVFRAGYGLFFLPNGAQQGSNQGVPGYGITQNLTSAIGLPPVFALAAGPPPYIVPTAANRTGAISNGSSITWWPYYAPLPYIQEWQASLQKQFGADTLLELAYVGSKGTHLLFPRDGNQVPVNLLGTGPNAQLLRPYPQYNQITIKNVDGFSSYHSLQIKGTKRFSNGLTFLANYTFSKAIDNSSYDTTTGIGNEYQINSNPNLNKGLAQFDQTHRVVVSYVYELPIGRGRTFLNRGGIVDAVLGGWRNSASFIANSGIPFDIFSGAPNRTGAISGYVYADCNGNPSGPQTAAQWFNTSAFGDPAPYRFGTCGRDIVRGPGAWNLDLNLTKDFTLHWERLKLQARGDAFNVLNHANLGQPGATTGSTAFGRITSASAARQLQAGLQLTF